MLDFLLIITLLSLIVQNIILTIKVESIKRKCLRTARPLYFRAKHVRTIQKGDKMALVYEVTCAAPVDADVVERRLTVSVNGETVSTDAYDGSAVNLGEKTFNSGDNVVLTLVDVDDVGNQSEASVVEFVAADTLPPVQPSFSVKLVREE